MSDVISVIVPVYNGSATIGRCIASIAAQTHKELEIIVIDDGSEDNTCEIVEKLSETDSRILLKKQANSGQGLARNAGMKIASGSYIGFVDADDEIEPEMYHEMYEAAEAHGAQVVQCNILDVYPNGLSKVQLSNYSGLVYVGDRRDYFSNYLAKSLHSYECCNKLFRHDFICAFEFVSNELVYSEDLLFNLEFSKRLDTILFINKPFYKYYQSLSSHSNSYTLERMDKLFNLFEIAMRDANGLENEIARIAVLIIMLMLAQIIFVVKDREQIKQRLRRKDLRYYIWRNLCSVRRLRQKVLMLLLLTLPLGLRMEVIRIYYFNLGS